MSDDVECLMMDGPERSLANYITETERNSLAAEEWIMGKR